MRECLPRHNASRRIRQPDYVIAHRLYSQFILVARYHTELLQLAQLLFFLKKKEVRIKGLLTLENYYNRHMRFLSMNFYIQIFKSKSIAAKIRRSRKPTWNEYETPTKLIS